MLRSNLNASGSLLLSPSSEIIATPHPTVSPKFTPPPQEKHIFHAAQLLQAALQALVSDSNNHFSSLVLFPIIARFVVLLQITSV